MDISARAASHFRSSMKPSKLFLYSKLHSLGIQSFGLIFTPIPGFLRLATEATIIRWFNPPLNGNQTSPQNSGTQLIAPQFKGAFRDLKDLKKGAPSPIPKSCSLAKRKSQSDPPSFHLSTYKDISSGTEAPNLLTILSLPSIAPDRPTFISFTERDIDISDFSFLDMLYPHACTIFVDKTQRMQITSNPNAWQALKHSKPRAFILCNLDPSHLIKAHLLKSTLPKLISGYLSPSTVFKGIHPFWIFKAYQTCNLLPAERQISIAKTIISNHCAATF